MTQQLDDVITALEAQVEHDKGIIDSSKLTIAQAKIRLREAEKLLAQLKKVRSAGDNGPVARGNYPCSQCPFVGAAPAGLSLHITVKHTKPKTPEPAPSPEPKLHEDTVDDKLKRALGRRGDGETIRAGNWKP